MILTPCCILLLPFPAFLLSILSFFAVTLPCYSFGSSFYQRKLQISKHAVGGEANSCFFFILRFYHCSESLSSNPQSCNLIQCSKPSTSRLGPAILQPPASGRVSSTRASGSSHNHSSWLRAPPGLRILHIPFQLLWLFLNVQTFFWSICFIHLRPFSSTARHPRRRIAWLYSTQHFPPIHHAFLSSEVSTSSSVLRTPPACYFCVSPIRASRSYFNTQAWQICQIAFSSELMYADLPELAFLALRNIVLAAKSEAFNPTCGPACGRRRLLLSRRTRGSFQLLTPDSGSSWPPSGAPTSLRRPPFSLSFSYFESSPPMSVPSCGLRMGFATGASALWRVDPARAQLLHSWLIWTVPPRHDCPGTTVTGTGTATVIVTSGGLHGGSPNRTSLASSRIASLGGTVPPGRLRPDSDRAPSVARPGSGPCLAGPRFAAPEPAAAILMIPGCGTRPTN